MPLIRKSQSSPPVAQEAGASAIGRLSSPDPEARWKAAREIGPDVQAVTAIAAALRVETSPQVREALFTSLVTIRTQAAARAAADFVRSDDAAVRTGALDALAAMPDAVALIVPDLLRDQDRDVRLLSCELARNLDASTAAKLLTPLLQSDSDPSVCGAAVEILAEIGAGDAVPALKACKARFPGEAFLGFAIDDAIERASQPE